MNLPFKWEFRSRFRTNAFGWRGSKLAIQRLNEAAKEIRGTKDPILRAEGAILLLERLWPALQQVDSSSGALGTATNAVVHELVQYIIDAPADTKLRGKWLGRLWQAMEEDGVDFLYEVSERWGEVCVDPEVASGWAEQLRFPVELTWKEGGYYRGAPAFLSCLLQAQRHEELLARIDQAPYLSWFYRRYGVKALAAAGKWEEAIRYAEASQGHNDSYTPIAAACEAILLDAGRIEEAYRCFALAATSATNHLARFRSLAKKYPHLPPEQILGDLIANSPGEEGKWFATAKTLGFFELAAALAHKSPVDIATLNRAARDFFEKEPAFALESALAALHWLAAGRFYEITGADVHEAVRYACELSAKLGKQEEVLQRISAWAQAETTDAFVRQQMQRAHGILLR